MEMAIIQTGGKQYKVHENQELLIELVPGKKEKDKIEFEDMLSKKKVTSKVLKEEKSDKIYIFKYKNKTRYRRKNGHRQNYLKIRIESIK